MSEERRDDEIIGRALSRAIETIDVNQTPFERSRIATAPARRSLFGLWQMATAAAAIVLALAIGSWLTRPTEQQPGVAASPSVPASPSATFTTTPAPSAATVGRVWVYYSRDGLPPVGAFAAELQGSDNSTPGARINARLAALWAAPTGQVPAGATNPMSLVNRTAAPGRQGLSSNAGVSGDLATVEFDLSDWNVRGSAESTALLQQLVYTITEEPGVRRVMITQRSKPAVIDQLLVDKPLSREDVSGYAGVTIGDNISEDGPAGGRLSYTTSTDKLTPGLTRFVVTAQVADTPRFSVQAGKGDDTAQSPGKYVLTVQVLGNDDKQGLETFDSSPLRGVMTTKNVATGTGSAVTTYELLLDDLRPWRVFTLSNPTRVVVDIGGAPQSISDRIAVYQLLPGAAGTREVQVTGAARVFEASVSWRLKDQSGREVASGHFLASLGSSAVWGTFDARIAIPASLTGPGTLELFEASARDGTPQGLVQIQLGVR